MAIDTERLTHASVCLDNALEEAMKGNEKLASEWIAKCKKSLAGAETPSPRFSRFP